MIVEFSVKNYRSVKELQTLSFVAAPLKSTTENESVDINNVVNLENIKLLKTVGIYGANGSGKSSVIYGLMRLLRLLRKDVSASSHLKDLCEPFMMEDGTESFFQVVVMLNGKKYRYGFTVMKNMSATIEQDGEKLENEYVISSEWLFGTKNTNMTQIFLRKLNKVDYSSLPDKNLIPESLENDHNLFITRAAAYIKDGICRDLRTYLGNWTTSNLSSNHEEFRQYSLRYLNSPFLNREKNEDALKDKLRLNAIERKSSFIKMLGVFGIHYEDVLFEDDKISAGDGVYPQSKIYVIKEVTNEEGVSKKVKFNLKKHESDGTKKMFDLAGLLLLTFGLNKPGFVCLDELDSNFHPFLLLKIINLFNDSSINKSNSQLLFTCHDTNLMDPSIMRRDQFYFTEKDEFNRTKLYSLADLKGVRNAADFAKHYLLGYYGGVPILNSYYDDEVDSKNQDEKDDVNG